MKILKKFTEFRIRTSFPLEAHSSGLLLAGTANLQGVSSLQIGSNSHLRIGVLKHELSNMIEGWKDL